MGLLHELDTIQKCIKEAFRRAKRMGWSESEPASGEPLATQWVIVYRTAHGFCTVYRGQPVAFEEMLDVQIWAEERDVQAYYLGL
jgi:hypothetical protein